MALTLVEARQLAADINADGVRAKRAKKDIYFDIQSKKASAQLSIKEAGDNSFAAAAKDFLTEHVKPKTRNWKETFTLLGFDQDRNLEAQG